MQISRRGALIGVGAAAVVAGVPGAVQAVEPLLAMERAWSAQRYFYNGPALHDESDEAREPHFRRLEEMEWSIYQTPAQTPQGVATKLRLWSRYYACFHERCYEGEWWKSDLDRMTFAEFGFANVMRDLERLAGEVRP